MTSLIQTLFIVTLGNKAFGLAGNLISCPCQNGFCDDRTAACKCDKGWTGVFCERAVLSEICPQGCGVNGVCDSLSKKCICNFGYHGNGCEMKCPFGYYGLNCDYQCKDHCDFPNFLLNACDATTGACYCENLVSYRNDYDSCEKKCRFGLTAVNGTCSGICPSGRFGFDCKQQCPVTIGSNGTCDSRSGRSKCKPGYKGFFCTEQCSLGTFGTDCIYQAHCKTGQNNFISGDCQCFPGWTGVSCTEECPNGTFGQNCLKRCFCVNGRCNTTNGDCECFPGSSGLGCEKACDPGRWGLNCVFECDCLNGAGCNASDGKCECAAGFFGAKCELPCPRGRFGANCSQECTCKNGSDCDPRDGKCSCLAGWTGADCSLPCPDGWHGEGCGLTCVCENGAACHPVNGTCRCTAGYFGDYCERPCKNGTWGNACANECPSNCTNGCSNVNGSCITCPEGWTGDDCLEPTLEENSYNITRMKYKVANNTTWCELNCNNGSVCDPITGHNCVYCLDSTNGTVCEEASSAGKSNLLWLHLKLLTVCVILAVVIVAFVLSAVVACLLKKTKKQAQSATNGSELVLYPNSTSGCFIEGLNDSTNPILIL